MLRPASAANRRVVNTSSTLPRQVDNDGTIDNERLHTRKQTKTTAIQSFLSNQWLLCSRFPILILIVIASLDNADKQLLASSFPILEKVLHWDIQQLGYFSLCTNLSYALSLPMWGWLIHHPNRNHPHGSSKSPSSAKVYLQQLLAYACAVWGVATIGIAIVTSPPPALALLSWFGGASSIRAVSWLLQVIVRCINGVALGSILPLSQSLLAEYTPIHLRGQAFGLMGAGEKLAGTLSSSLVVYLGEHYWQYAYFGLGIASIVAGTLSHHMTLHQSTMVRRKEHDGTIVQTNDDDGKGTVLHNDGSDNDESDVLDLTLRQIVERIVRLPAFICLVAQGVFGGTPWDMMSFLLLLMDWRGFTKNQIVTVQFSSGLSSMLGGWLGGIMGDYAAAIYRGSDGHGGATNSSGGSSQGRILLALVSVVGGIPLYGLFLYSTDFLWALLWINLFSVWATWTPPGAIRPICADLTRGPSERAQIVALWIVLEKVSGALFGAPLVGYLTDRMLAKDRTLGHNPNDMIGGSDDEKARALAFNLLALSSAFWGICAFFWFVMFLTIRKSNPGRRPLSQDGSHV